MKKLRNGDESFPALNHLSGLVAFVFFMTSVQHNQIQIPVFTPLLVFPVPPHDISRLRTFYILPELHATYTIKNYEDILINYGFIGVDKSHLVKKAHVINYMTDGML